MGCREMVSTLTFWEQQQGIEARLWNQKQYWGHFCAWCVKMARIRFAWMSLPQLYDHVSTSPQNADEFRHYTIAYISIRQEGRTQISAEMLENRLAVLFHCRSLLRPEEFYEYRLLPDFLKSTPECDPRMLSVVQMSHEGAPRLGVQVLRPQPLEGTCPPSSMSLDSRLRSSAPEDLQALAVLDKRLADIVSAAGGDSAAGSTTVTPRKSAQAASHAEADDGKEGQLPSARKGAPGRTCGSPAAALAAGRGGGSGSKFKDRSAIVSTLSWGLNHHLRGSFPVNVTMCIRPVACPNHNGGVFVPMSTCPKKAMVVVGVLRHRTSICH